MVRSVTQQLRPNNDYGSSALHSAYSTGGAQFYVRLSRYSDDRKSSRSMQMSCAQINITGGGSFTPSSTVSFPGAYSPNDPYVVSLWRFFSTHIYILIEESPSTSMTILVNQLTAVNHTSPLVQTSSPAVMSHPSARQAPHRSVARALRLLQALQLVRLLRVLHLVQHPRARQAVVPLSMASVVAWDGLVSFLFLSRFLRLTPSARTYNMRSRYLHKIERLVQ